MSSVKLTVDVLEFSVRKVLPKNKYRLIMKLNLSFINKYISLKYVPVIVVSVSSVEPVVDVSVFSVMKVEDPEKHT